MVYAGFATCRVRYMVATHRPSSLPQLTEFGSAVDKRTIYIYNLFVREVLNLYIFCFAKF